MKCNVGGIDRLARIVLGIGIIGAGIVTGSWLGAIGLVPLVTGAASRCPLYLPLKKFPRTATVDRITKETNINVKVNLDGSGKSSVETGIGFLDHMLDQVAKHGGIDLSIIVKGDFHIDEHHSVEDLGIVLGEAILKALGGKKGIERYGFMLPMDDSLATVAIDFGGRPWLVWNVELRREKIGEMPTEMFFHFFKSFSDSARCNLNISADGENEHHKMEAVFKAFAKALKMAISKTDNYNLPTTKGSL
jgi:imidazoleglycerol-phosphate dehydratase/histidinol-phosphatase